MQAINTRISDEMNNKLVSLAKKLRTSKSYIVRKALSSYLIKLQEDIEDCDDAVRISAMNNQSYPLEEVIKDLGLKDELDN